MGLGSIEAKNMDFRLVYPNDKPSSRAQFREAFVAYERDVTCLAGALRDLRPVTSRLAEYDTAFDNAMAETIAVMAEGRDAVSKRNTSAYRDWRKKIDGLPELYDQLDPLLQR